MFLVNNSICSSCNITVNDGQIVKCVHCENVYHAICTAAPTREAQICNATFLSHFLKPSTSANFTWTCDSCATIDETERAASVRQLITTMATNHTDQIKSLTTLVNQLSDKVDALSLPNQPALAPNNPWSDESRLKRIKSSVVVKPDDQGNNVSSRAIRQIATDAGIPIDSVVEQTNGETFINLPDVESRDKVQEVLQQSHTQNPIVRLESKLPTVSILGVTARDMKKENNEDLDREELRESIKQQNKSISDMIDNGSKLEVVHIKAPPGEKKYYTVAVRVSPDIRTVIHRMKDKIHFGCTIHTAEDRFHVKRCNRCQTLGHYADKCDMSTPVVCGYCAKEHKSDDCPDKNKPKEQYKCINCSGEGLPASGHSTFWTKCPAYKAAQGKQKKTIAFDYSNLN